jgi:uncharacterized membrane protein YqjE
MADLEQRREKGMSLMFIGLAILVADLLVIFYLPAGVRLGSQATFMWIISVLAIAGLAFVVGGWFLRRNTGEE